MYPIDAIVEPKADIPLLDPVLEQNKLRATCSILV
jgi:hypothetical protein